MQKDLPEAWQNIQHAFTGRDSWKLLLELILMLINWSLEAKKWQLLVEDVQQISFLRSFKAIFSGQAFAFNTVNNMGEYVGRVMYLEEGHRLKAISITIVGSIAQFIATLLMGVLGLVYIKYYVLDAALHLSGIHGLWLNGLIFAVSVGTIGLLILYYCLSWIISIVDKIPFISRFTYLIDTIEKYHWKKLNQILFLSIVRYWIFVIQYLILLNVFKVGAPLIASGWMVCVMFLVLAIIPSIAMAELGLRGEISKVLFSLLSTNILGITFTAGVIWLINRVLPALAGSLFIISVRLFKK